MEVTIEITIEDLTKYKIDSLGEDIFMQVIKPTVNSFEEAIQLSAETFKMYKDELLPSTIINLRTYYDDELIYKISNKKEAKKVFKSLDDEQIQKLIIKKFTN